jgi:Putative esterase
MVRAASALRALALVAVILLILSAQAASATAPSDDFNRPNGSLGSNWVAMSDGALSIASQAVVGTGATAGDIRTAETYSSDQSSQIQLTSTQLSGGQWVGPTVRTQNGGQNTYLGIYFWNSGSQQLRLYKRNAGTWIQLGNSYNSGPLAAGTTLQLSAVGSTISFLQDGVTRITATDTSVSGGAPGIMTYGQAKADNWSGAGAGGSAPTYSVGGSTSGLSGTVVLRDNGGDDLTLTANGPFAFATRLAGGAAYNVTVKTNPSGQTCSVANGSGTIGSADVTNVAVTCGTGNNGFSATYRSTDANGVDSYDVTSADNGPGTQTLRVLAPTHPAAGVPHSFLYVLPVEAGLGTVYGDGMATLEALDAQNQYNLTIIEPSFGIEPWYADNPNGSNLRYETFMTNDLVPWVTQNLSTTGHEQKWLIGFSKSGIGGQDLILKHPDVFTLAASWDFPADMSSYSQFGGSSANQYGTDANFQANYRLTPIFLEGHKLPFISSNRIWIGGYQAFQTDMSDYDALLNSEGIPHTTETPMLMPHRWDSGWVQIALAALSQDSQNLTTSP